MRKVHIDNAVPGTRLGRSILDHEGRILLSAGTIIEESYLKRLKLLGITEIYIDDDISHGVEIRDVVTEETRHEAKVLLKNMASNGCFKGSLDVGKVKKVIDKIIDELLENRDILMNLSDIKTFDSYTFEHCVNVSILSMMTAIELGYDKNKIRELGIGAILHDIGKMKIPIEILNKPDKLTDEEFDEVKKHTTYGYGIIKKVEGISSISAYVVLAHHERYNGTGYPLGIKGNKIHQCARIAAVADVFDALTSDRVYRKKLHPSQAIQYINAFSACYFDEEVVRGFTKNIAVYPEGTGVVLNTGEKGIVVKNYKSMPTRPVVRIIYDEDNNKLKDFYEIDLTQRFDVVITDVCNI